MGAVRGSDPPAGRAQGLYAAALEPTNPFEVAIAERLKALQGEVDQLRSRINWLLAVIVGAAITNVVIALLR